MTATDAPARARLLRPARPVLLVALIGLAWFATTLWLTHNGVVSAPSPDIAVVNAALAIPLVIAAGLVAGGGLAACLSGGGRWRAPVGAGIGLVLGGLAGGLILLGYGTASAVVWLAVAVAVATAAGGALVGIPLPGVLVAGLAGTLAWFAVGVVEGLFGGALRGLFTADETPAAQLSGAARLSLTVALAGGALAGVVAYLLVRRSTRAWPVFLVAGGLPGALLLVADVLTRIGAGPLLRLVRQSGIADQIALDYVGSNRLTTALVVLFTGAITAMFLHGRTLKPRTS